MQPKVTTTRGTKINYRSDFAILIDSPDLIASESDLYGIVTTMPSANPWHFSRVGGVYHNCSVTGGGRLLVALNNHKLSPGSVMVAIDTDTPDSTFADGRRRTGAAYICEGEVVLVPGRGDDTEEVDLEVTMPFATVTAYDLAVRYGYTGTAEQYMEALSIMPAVVSDARDAADDARGAATEADSATEGCIRTTDKANQAALDAADAAVEAERAAGNANQAAQLLTDKVNQVVEAAEVAANSAGNATDFASAAGARADTAANDANEAASEARGFIEELRSKQVVTGDITVMLSEDDVLDPMHCTTLRLALTEQKVGYGYAGPNAVAVPVGEWDMEDEE